MKRFAAALLAAALPLAAQQPSTILHAAHLLDVASGKLVSPGEILITGERITEVGSHVTHPATARVLDLGNVTLMPGLIDAHTHLFLHPGNEGLQTVEESIPQRTLTAAAAAKADLLAGFTAERDMGTEGAKCADVAVRNAINKGEIPGPRMRVSCNAIDILGGHEDAIGFNPEQHVLSNADIVNNTAELIATMREQHKEGSDFFKIYETGHDHVDGNKITSAFQFTEPELAAAVAEAHRLGTVVAVHCTTDPGAEFAVAAGVASVDHAYQISEATMKEMRARNIYAVPTFTIAEYFADHAETPELAARRKQSLAIHVAEFKKQMVLGVPFAVGSDVGPFPHGTQAREYELMVQYGMKPADVLRAGLINGAKLLNWADAIGQLKPGFFADIIAVPGDPLADISVLTKPEFVMKNGKIFLDAPAHRRQTMN
ncbi:MAG: amidohydrolase family protein [Acidobacteriaceae bacterium]|nr:amidohydrolase family protein [Acidobacteriaceae bacterium]